MSNNQPPQRGQTAQQSMQQLPPNIDYDPRRLFPFGLSPIPELPSELASEVSSICSYSPIPSEDFYETEDEEENVCRSDRSSIMYSGSCSSIKSIDQVTIAENVDKTQKDVIDTDDDEDDDDTCTDDDDSSTEQDTYSTSEDSEDETESSEEEEDQKKITENDEVPVNIMNKTTSTTNDHQHYNSQVMTVMHQRSYNAQSMSEEANEKQDFSPKEILPFDMSLESSSLITQKIESKSSHEALLHSTASDVLDQSVQSKERTIPLVVEQPIPAVENTISKSSSNASADKKQTQPQTSQGVKTSKQKFNATAAGAATASEIFRHLQATRGKAEVTTELAKILGVLQTTLKLEENDSSSTDSSDTSTDSEEEAETHVLSPQDISNKNMSQGPNIVDKSELTEAVDDTEDKSSQSVPLGKPPIHPNIPLLQSKSAHDMTNRIGPQIQNRIRELGEVKPGSGKEEMNILSKILVTLLCSCKSASASGELKKIIHQFKDAATEAADEVPEELRPISSASHASSRASKSGKRRKKVRSRKSSATSSNSQSEAESLTNTLTPCDSKSSGTEDEGSNIETINKSLSRSASVSRSRNSTPVTSQTRLHFNVTVEDPPVMEETSDPSIKDGEKQADPNVTFTISLPKRASVSPTKIVTEECIKKESKVQANEYKNEVTKTGTVQAENQDDEYEYDEDEWEWDCDDEEDGGTGSEETTKTSRDNTDATQAGKRNDSTSSSREISISEEKSAGEHSAASSTVRKLLTDMECGAYNSDSLYSPGHQSGQSDVGTTSEQEQSLHESPEYANNQDSDSDSTTEWSSGDEEDKKGKIKVAKTSGKITISNGNGEVVQQQPLLMTHLQETFNVLNGAYQIITGTNLQEEEQNSYSKVSGFQASEATSALITIDSNNKPDIGNGVNNMIINASNTMSAKSIEVVTQDLLTNKDNTGINTEVEHKENGTSMVNNRLIPSSRPQSRQQTSRPQSRQRVSRPSSKMGSRSTSRQSNRGKEGGNDDEEDWGDSDEWEYYYEDDEDYEEEEEDAKSFNDKKEQTPTNKMELENQQTATATLKSIMHQTKETSIYKSEFAEVMKQSTEYTARKTGQNSVAFDIDKKETPLLSNTIQNVQQAVLQQAYSMQQACASQLNTSNKTEEVLNVSRPVSRQRRLVQTSRPGSRTGSRPGSKQGSRPPSRTCSRMSARTPGLDGVLEENEEGDESWEWEYYYEDDEEDDELSRLSPTLTTAPATRTTSPFPYDDFVSGNSVPEKSRSLSNKSVKMQTLENKQSLLARKIDPREVQVITPQVSNATELSATPSPRWEELQKVCSMPNLNLDTALELIHSDPNILSPTKELSVVLAAEYLGQSAEEIAATLPSGFSVQSHVPDDSISDTASLNNNKKKHKKKAKKNKEKEGDWNETTDEKKKRHKKRKHPINVKELVGRLEPRLFQDSETGTKMVMEENTAKSVIATAKNEARMNAANLHQDKRGYETQAGSFVDPMDAKSVGRVMSNTKDTIYNDNNSQPNPSMSSQQTRIIKDAKNPHEVQVIQGDQSTTVKMRQHGSQTSSKSNLQKFISSAVPGSPASLGARKKQISRDGKSRASPSESSEAYGTGSSGSDDTESQVTTNPDNGEERNNGNGRGNKVHSSSSKEASNDGSERHSRLFRLLQDSDYTDSDADSVPPSRQEQAPNTLPRRGSSYRATGNHEFETSDLESASSGIERKHSFRSIKSSGNESGDSSISGTNKVSPPSMRRDPGVKRYMSLGGLETCYENTGVAPVASFGGLQTTSLGGPVYPASMTSYQPQMVPLSHQPIPTQHYQTQHHQQQMYHHAMQLQQQQQSAFPFTPSSSEVSTPSSPTNAFSPVHGPCMVPGVGMQSKVKQQGPRVWNYQDYPQPISATGITGGDAMGSSNLSSSYSSSGIELEPTSPSHYPKNYGHVVGTSSSQTLFSSSSDYTTMQHQAHQQYGGESSEVENILLGSSRITSGSGAATKLVRPSTIIGLTSMGNTGQPSPPSGGVNRLTPSSKLSGAPPSHMTVEALRNLSPTYRNSPKFEIDLQDLSNLPPAPAFKGIQRRVSMNYSPFSSNNPHNTHNSENNT